jgi:hypothetical protein
MPTPTAQGIPTLLPAPAGWYVSKYTYNTNIPYAVTSLNRRSFTIRPITTPTAIHLHCTERSAVQV